MASTIQQANLTGLPTFLPATAVSAGWQTYQQNRHRVYALAFWMTDHELMAEELMQRAFSRAFALDIQPTAESIDRALVSELRTVCPLGPLALRSESVCEEVLNVRRNTLRVHLERAIVQLPATERMIFLMHDVESYDHARIGRMLGISPEESQAGLHQARLQIRNLVSTMPR